MASLKVVCVVVVMCMVVVAAPMADAAINCRLVASLLAPCVPYLTGNQGPFAQCCGGVKALNVAANTTPDRQAACKCLKTLADAIPGIKLDNAAQLPHKCGVNIPYKISPSTNCATIKF